MWKCCGRIKELFDRLRTDRDGLVAYNPGLIADKLEALDGTPVGIREGRTTMSDDVQAERIEQLIGALRDDNEALRDHAMGQFESSG